MKRALKATYLRLTSYDFEVERLIGYIEQRCARRDSKILEVGCGRGRLLRPLVGRGRTILGLDENESLVAANRESGLPCVTPAEFAASSETFDVMVMSHVIEHFAPEALVDFMDRHLDRLRPGGFLVVASPLESPYFHEDLDHVRPYPPASLQMAFAPGLPQTRHRPRNRLVLRDLWYRRAHFRPVSFAGRQMKRWSTLPLVAIESISALAFHLSLRLVGRKDGWVGVFEKS